MNPRLAIIMAATIPPAPSASAPRLKTWVVNIGSTKTTDWKTRSGMKAISMSC